MSYSYTNTEGKRLQGCAICAFAIPQHRMTNYDYAAEMKKNNLTHYCQSFNSPVHQSQGASCPNWKYDGI